MEIGQSDPNNSRLPVQCDLAMLFVTAVVAEMVVIVLSLHDWMNGRFDFTLLTHSSLLAQWIVVVSNLILCLLHPWLIRLPGIIPAVLAFQIAPLVTALSTGGIVLLDAQLSMGLVPDKHEIETLVWGNTGMVMLVSAALFRYLYIRAAWQERIKLEAQARFHALQARIRPHFLFNSMNTIASLIASRPEQAETVVEDLSELFRAALNSDQNKRSIRHEIKLLDQYLAIEALRLGRRLKVNWMRKEIHGDERIPALMLQPLVENAIYHGIQTCVEGGTIDLDLWVESDDIYFTVSNPYQAHVSEGHGMAQKNIRDRLDLMYGGQGLMTISQTQSNYTVTLKIPLDNTHEA